MGRPPWGSVDEGCLELFTDPGDGVLQGRCYPPGWQVGGSKQLHGVEADLISKPDLCCHFVSSRSQVTRYRSSSPIQPLAGTILASPTGLWIPPFATAVSWCSPKHPSRPIPESPYWRSHVESTHSSAHSKALGWYL
jgi:hypothetical protein